MSTLRKGRTKTLIENAIDSALLAVEIYNKPRAPFRVENFITNMIMAWTRLFQAHFNHTIGDKYFYKEKNGRYKLIDGERKAWELKTCIDKYGSLSEPVRINLDFFIKLRNKIEHHCIDKEEIGLMIFGECQALLYNFENEVILLFGKDYAMNESLAFSLQFSTIRTQKQTEASKKLLSQEVKNLKGYIENFRNCIKEDVFNSQYYSIKLIRIPKISNTNKNDLAIEFVNWNSLSEEDKINYGKLSAIIKDKILKTEVLNAGRLKPGDVIKKILEQTGVKFNHYDHKCCYTILAVRPSKEYSISDPFQTNTTYCHYDEAHNDYLFKESWITLLASNIKSGQIHKPMWKENFEKRITLDISDFESIL